MYFEYLFSYMHIYIFIYIWAKLIKNKMVYIGSLWNGLQRVMFHSQRYPLNLCLRNNEKDVIVDPQNQRIYLLRLILLCVWKDDIFYYVTTFISIIVLGLERLTRLGNSNVLRLPMRCLSFIKFFRFVSLILLQFYLVQK